MTKLILAAFKYLTQGLLAAGLLVFPLFYLPLTNDPFNFPKEYLLYLIVIVAVILFLIPVFFRSELKWRRTIFDTPLLILAGILIISTLLAKSRSVSFFGRSEMFLAHTSVFLAWIIWFFLMIQVVTTLKLWRIMHGVVIASGLLVSLLFILKGFIFLPDWLRIGNSISRLNSHLGIFTAILVVWQVGLALYRQKISYYIWYGLGSLLAFIVLFQLGFAISWVLTAIGLGLLIGLALLRLNTVPLPAFFCCLALFIVSLLASIFGSPEQWKTELPTEVALGAKASWNAITDSYMKSGKGVVFGNGPATFPYLFAEWRGLEFNLTPLAENTYFNSPYSSILGFLAEIGWSGLAVFVGIIILLISVAVNIIPPGILFKLSTRLRRIIKMTNKDASGAHVEWSAVFVAWLISTIGLAVSFYEITLWWLWWFLTSSSAIGAGFIANRKAYQARDVSLSFAPPYGALVSFTVVISVSVISVLGVYDARFFMAEVQAKQAGQTSDLTIKRLYLTKATKYRNAYAPYHSALSEVYLQEAAKVSQQRSVDAEALAEALKPAIEEAKKAVELEPYNFRLYENLGMIYLNAAPLVQNASAWAIDSFKSALKQAPSNYEIQTNLGNAYLLTGDQKNAEETFKNVIHSKPNFLPAYIKLAELYEQQSNLDKAISVYQPLGQFLERNPELLFRVGRLFFNRNQAGDIDKAELAWKRAEELMPDFANVLYSLGLLSEKKGNTAEALNYYRKVEALNPDNGDIKTKIKSVGGE